ncbi:unnamed protein product [Larinioides sclopetarius]|uniref:LIM/homeobox protein Lhx9 n=1 Tax=Larinioides sclopetarius TaxID=280406 RepID=A0AAV2B9P3_9ARAC
MQRLYHESDTLQGGSLDHDTEALSRNQYLYHEGLQVTMWRLPRNQYFARLFAVKRCARCQRGIFANELVMRARDLVYHLHCFTCAWCNTALTQGDYFGLRDNLVYCRGHYELMMHGESFLPNGTDGTALLPRYPGLTLLHPGQEAAPSTGAFTPFSGVTGTVRKGRPRKRKATDAVVREGLLSQTLIFKREPDAAIDEPIAQPAVTGQWLCRGSQCYTLLETAEGCNLHLSSLESNSSTPAGHTGPQRTKRMRTSFKHHQLRTMKSYFAINQNPDAKDLKQLAQKTGLSKRVLQVWFQNARAKWRRNNLRQVDHPQGSQNSQNQQQSSAHVHSPGATSSFSEPSPCGGGGSAMGAELPPPAAPQLDYEANPPTMTSLVPRHVSPGGESLPLTSFQELF